MAHSIASRSPNQFCQPSDLLISNSCKFSLLINLCVCLQDHELLQSFLLSVLFSDDLCHVLNALKLYLYLLARYHYAFTLYVCRELGKKDSFFSIHHKRKFYLHYHSYFFFDVSVSYFRHLPSHYLSHLHFHSHRRSTHHRMNLNQEAVVKILHCY